MFGKKKPDEKHLTPAVAAFIELFRQPDDWGFGEHYATHLGGATVWIANRDCLWARKVVLPGIGAILPEGTNCKATADHRAVHAAVYAAQDAVRLSKTREYIVGAETERAKRRRVREEEARRLDFDAGSFEFAADQARRLAAQKRAQSSEAQPDKPISTGARG